MLYVFFVSTGTTMKFEMNLAVKKVLELKTEIAKTVHIPVEDQVLLCSGGEELKSDNIVGKYFGAGTDTNPIFLFSKCSTDSEFLSNAHMRTSSIDLSNENDVRGCASMTPSIEALAVRATLAQNFADSAQKGKRECTELVHQQHLQQQGWAAVIANLEDAKDCLLKRKQYVDEMFEKYLANRSFYQETITMFPDDIELLAKIPVLKKLIEGDCSEEDLNTNYTLLSWFCSEPQYILESLVEKCRKSIEQLSEHSLKCLNDDLEGVIQRAEKPDVKEVKGIEGRLSSLNRLIEEAEKLSREQNELRGIFSRDRMDHARDKYVLPNICTTYQSQLELMLHNQQCLREILEKCRRAKVELSDNINFRVKVICGLESDMYNLQVRLIFMEKHMKSVMNQIESFHQVHLAPQKYFKLLAEVCRRKEFSTSFIKWATELSSEASKLYHKEISLRKCFAGEDSKNMVDNLFPGMDDLPPSFAVECPCPFDQSLPDITKEDLNWLKSLFPDLSHFCEVLPPEPMPHISQAESDSAFSSNIPSSLKINSLENSHSNILKVHAKISALQKFIQDVQSSLQNDLSNLKASVKEDLCEGMSEASQVIENINNFMKKLHQLQQLEKEEAVNEYKKEFTSIENAYIHRLEVERQKLNDAENQILRYEEHLQEVKSGYEEIKHDKEQLVVDLQDKQELLQRIMLEHELEFDAFKNQTKTQLQDQDSKIAELEQALSNALGEVDMLQKEKADIEFNCTEKLKKEKELITELQEKQKTLNEDILQLQELRTSSKDVAELETRLQLTINEKLQYMKDFEEAQQNLNKLKPEMEKKKEVALKELEENLILKHKSDMESLRSRFRLAVSTTSISAVSSPSTSEPLDPEVLGESKPAAEEHQKIIDTVAETVNQELLKQEQENKKVIAAIQTEHEEALEKLKSRITAENQVSFNEAINRLAKEKDGIIDDLRSQISALEVKESSVKFVLDEYISTYKDATDDVTVSLSESSTSCSNLRSSDEYKTIAKLRKDLEPLFQSGSIRTESSHPFLQSSEGIQENLKKKLKSKDEEHQRAAMSFVPVTSCFNCCNKISILTCFEGDIVLLCYEEKNKNFAVFNIGPFLHFLHADSLQALNLKLPPGETQRWALGVVTKKEFCVIRKKENRYNVSCGTKFYRVKVKPWDRERALASHYSPRCSQVMSTICASKSTESHLPSDDGDRSKGSDLSSMSASAI